MCFFFIVIVINTSLRSFYFSFIHRFASSHPLNDFLCQLFSSLHPLPLSSPLFPSRRRAGKSSVHDSTAKSFQVEFSDQSIFRRHDSCALNVAFLFAFAHQRRRTHLQWKETDSQGNVSTETYLFKVLSKIYLH